MKKLNTRFLPKGGGKGGVREESEQHLPCLNPFVHRGLRPTTGGGEV